MRAHRHRLIVQNYYIFNESFLSGSTSVRLAAEAHAHAYRIQLTSEDE
jgi:hypothetical protein